MLLKIVTTIGFIVFGAVGLMIISLGLTILAGVISRMYYGNKPGSDPMQALMMIWPFYIAPAALAVGALGGLVFSIIRG